MCMYKGKRGLSAKIYSGWAVVWEVAMLTRDGCRIGNNLRLEVVTSDEVVDCPIIVSMVCSTIKYPPP